MSDWALIEWWEAHWPRGDWPWMLTRAAILLGTFTPSSMEPREGMYPHFSRIAATLNHSHRVP